MKLIVSACLLALSVVACTDEATTPSVSPNPPEADAGADAGALGPVYALMRHVFGVDDTRSVYFSLTRSLDVDDLPLDDAHEYQGVANYAAVGGRLLISDGEQPVITEFTIDDDLQWHEGKSIGFSSYPLADNANFFAQYMLDEHHMYLPYDISKRIVWDPTRFAILEEKTNSELPLERDGLTLEPAGNRGGIHYQGNVLQPFFFRDEDWFQFGTSSLIVSYDRQTHEESRIIEAPCPGLAVGSQDEQGNTYFSSWDYGPLLALYGQGLAPCVVKIDAEGEFDEDWTTDLRQWTGGRYSINFRYVRDGWGLADVLDADTLEANFSEDISEDVLDEIWDGSHWRVWRIDLKNETAEPFDDIDVPGLGWGVQRIDDRTFLTVPYNGNERTRLYELDAAGHAEESLDVLGGATWLRVR